MLHTREFFTDCKRALKSGGILVTQNGLPFLFPEHLQATTEIFASLFKRAAPYMCTQPCYFGGPFALNWASDETDLLEARGKDLAQAHAPSAASRLDIRRPACTRRAFALPGYAERVVEAAVAEAGDKGDKTKAYAEMPKQKAKATRRASRNRERTHTEATFRPSCRGSRAERETCHPGTRARDPAGRWLSRLRRSGSRDKRRDETAGLSRGKLIRIALEDFLESSAEKKS